MTAQTQHYTPGWSIVLSAARRVAGERETFLHWLEWPFAAMFLVGLFLLARVLGAPAWATLAACATSPVFLIPSASMMPDIPALGLGILGLAVWHAAPSLAGRIAGGLLLALAGQMKQSVLVLYPLLCLDPAGGLLRQPRAWAIAAGSLVLAGFYPNVAPHNPEHSSIVGHVIFILQATWSPVLLRAKASYLCAALGALILSPFAIALAFLPSRVSVGRRVGIAGLALLWIPVLSALGLWRSYRGTQSFWQTGVNLSAVPVSANTVWFYLAIAAAIGWGFLVLRPANNGGEPVRGPARWLRAWLLLAGAGFAFGTYFPAARHMIPLLPPLVMLYLADLRRHGGERAFRAGTALLVAWNLWLGLSLARNDFLFARVCKAAAIRGAEIAAAKHLPLMTTGSWGLRYYAEKLGGEALGKATEPVPRGAVFLVPRLTDHRVLPAALRRRSRLVERITLQPSRLMPLVLPVLTIPPVRSMSAFHGGQVWFPYAFSRAPSETVDVLEIRPLSAPVSARRAPR
jgi:hypothetical protein